MSTISIKNNELLEQVEGNLVSNMDGEKVMLSIASGKYYNLGEVGGAIWELLESPKSMNEIVDTLTLEYEVEREDCEKQTAAFIKMLLLENIVRVKK